jgi:predicted N-acetyltransferase YhbS
VTYRDATETDLPAARKLAEQFSNHVDAPWPWAGRWDDLESQLCGAIKDGQMVVAEDGGEVVGMASFLASEPTTAVLANLAVGAKHQGNGVGKALVEKVSEKANRRGFGVLTALIWSGGAVGFYERAGMNPVATLFTREV